MIVKLIPLDAEQPTFGPFDDVVKFTFTSLGLHAVNKDGTLYHVPLNPLNKYSVQAEEISERQN